MEKSYFSPAFEKLFINSLITNVSKNAPFIAPFSSVSGVNQEVKKAAKEVKETVKKAAKEIKKAVKEDYSSMTLAELKAVAKEKKISGYSTMKKAELIDALK